jgi:mono/diheme cytochrome c family protein
VRVAGLAVVFIVSVTMIAVSAQNVPASVFTQQQADAGRVAYLKNCAMCHIADLSGNNEIPPLVGGLFMGTWGNKTTKDLRDYMSGAMPYGGPSLDAETYTVIAAFILSSNGAAAGADALTPLTAARIGSLPCATPSTKSLEGVCGAAGDVRSN